MLFDSNSGLCAMHNLCRTCLRTPQKPVNLKNSSELVTKIETVASIKVEMHNDLPNSVCGECVSNINKLYNFRKVIRNSDLELRERLQALENSKRIIQNTNDKLVENAKLTTQNIEDEQVQNETQEIIKIENDVKQETVVDNQSNILKTRVPKRHIRTQSALNPDTIKIAKHWGYNAEQNVILYDCKDCNLTFKGYLIWRRHQKTAHAERGMCNVCGKTIRKENLSKHVRNHSNGHVCKVCGESFKNYVLMRTHTYEHHKGTELYCDICGKIFYYQGDLNRHVKQHSRNSPRVPCAVCGKSIQKRDMKRHIRTHTGERRYPCQYCKRAFFNLSGLKMHTLLHTNEKPYICEYCSMAFTQKTSLQIHIRTKHLKKD